MRVPDPPSSPDHTAPPPPGGDSGSLLATFTLSLWLGCLIVGGLGLVLHYPRERLPPPQPPPVMAETVKVDLTRDAAPNSPK